MRAEVAEERLERDRRLAVHLERGQVGPVGGRARAVAAGKQEGPEPESEPVSERSFREARRSACY